MAISTSKTEIYAEGTTDISWTNLQSNLGAQEPTNIRFGTYKRTPNDTSETPLIPDADENANIGTEESGNLRVGAFRGAIKDHTVTFDGASEYENVQFDKYFGANLIKNVPKNINVNGLTFFDNHESEFISAFHLAVTSACILDSKSNTICSNFC
jgi:hypothetical protein